MSIIDIHDLHAFNSRDMAYLSKFKPEGGEGGGGGGGGGERGGGGGCGVLGETPH